MSFAQVFVNSEPDEGIIKGMSKLRELPDGSRNSVSGLPSQSSEGVVFSDFTRGHWISFAGKVNVMDENVYLAPDADQRFEDSQTLFRTRDIEEAAEIIKKYNIKYIWIDSGMKKKLWKEEEEGLLFLLKYNPDLSRVYGMEGVEIWEVEGTLNP